MNNIETTVNRPHKIEKNMRKFSLLLLILTIGLASCKNGEKKSEGPTQMEEVMAVHDNLMPKMSDISSLMSELETKIDSSQSSTQYQKAINDLEASHKAMMDWMKDFGAKFDVDEILKGKPLTQEKQQLLDQEQKEVDDLKKQIETSIANAKNLLGK